MYWTDRGVDAISGRSSIQRTDLDGADVEVLVTGLDYPTGVAVDNKGAKIYWTSGGNIHRSDLDGSNIEIIHTDVNPNSIALDTHHGKIYWTTSWSKLGRSDVDGSNLEFVVTHLRHPDSVALDTDEGKVYWTVGDGSGYYNIQRANLDGTDVEDVITELERPNNIVLHVDEGKIYWTDEVGFRDSSVIMRADLDGSDVERVVTHLNYASGMTIDSEQRKLYWADGDLWTAKIRRIDLPAVGWNKIDAAQESSEVLEHELPDSPSDSDVDSTSSTGGSRVRFRDCDVCPELVESPAGTFMMGSLTSEEGRYDDEMAPHLATIQDPFAVGVYEVTFEEWDACVREGGCEGYRPDDEGWGRGNRPVIKVSWDDAQKYVEWLTGRTGREYRLLSATEWEYVARAGTSTARYWGESATEQCRYANGADATAKEQENSWTVASCEDGYYQTAPVGTFEPNRFGLYDVLGNVWEWVSGCRLFDSRTFECSYRMIRGGSWNNEPRALRSANDAWMLDPESRKKHDVGFRVARTL